MSEFDEITAMAEEAWPEADHFDIIPSPASDATVNDSDAKSIRLNAIHPDGSIIEQLIADDRESLAAKLKARLGANDV
jgi:hypothetical protein